jgi:hypothetical protein
VRACGEKTGAAQRRDQITADPLAEHVADLHSRDRLKIRNHRQGRLLERRESDARRTDGTRAANDGRVGRPHAMLITAGNADNVVGPRAQLVLLPKQLRREPRRQPSAR